MKYLMCNLKSNKNLKEILEFKQKLKNVNLNGKEFVLFPSNIYISFFYDVNYKIGAQNVSIYDNGSYTGEVLASQLASLKVSYCLINHCETIETSENAIKKIQNATKENIKVVYCIGKNTKDIEIETLKMQVKEIFNKLTREEMENIILAYEPCWAINKEDIIEPKDICFVIKEIKQYIYYEYNINVSVIYGGSININNFDILLKIENLDGYLIGNCSNNPENIVKLADKLQ